MKVETQEVIGRGHYYYWDQKAQPDLYTMSGEELPVGDYDIRMIGQLELVVLPWNVQ